MNRLSFLALLAMWSCPAFAQQPPDQAAGTLSTAVPIAPVVMPPDVPPRPPLVAIPPGTPIPAGLPNNSPIRESLAWRAKAHKLRISPAASQQTLNTNYDAAIMTLISALSQSGLRVHTLNSKAGELLAVPVDTRSTQRYVFVVSEMPPGTVTIKGTAWSQSKTSAATLDAVFQSLRNTQVAGTQRSSR